MSFLNPLSGKSNKPWYIYCLILQHKRKQTHPQTLYCLQVCMQCYSKQEMALSLLYSYIVSREIKLVQNTDLH